MISAIGGYAGTITYFIQLFLTFYQGFMFESSLIKRLYRERKDNDIKRRHSYHGLDYDKKHNSSSSDED
jgi:hypothetical protein